MKRTLLVAALLAAAALAGAAGWHFAAADPEEDGTLTLYGNVEIRDAELAFDERERVARVRVEEGAAVEKGQILAELERGALRDRLAEACAERRARKQIVRRLTNGRRPQEIAEARARVRAARARADNAKRLVERLERTAESGAASAQRLDDARAELRVAEAELAARKESLDLARAGFRVERIAEAKAALEARRARVSRLERRLEETVLRAPQDGVIQSRLIEEGEMASPGQPVLVLALARPKWVRAFLPEPDLGRVKRGMRVRVRTDSFPTRAFEGWIGFISPEAEFTPKRVETPELRTKLVYETRIRVEDPKNQLRLGMPVTAEIRLEAPAANAPASRPAEGAS